uniref:Copia protein n=1 Tax=Physcomitrium patens TaxID=3218 RepID=A0A2K1LAX2_PHYPA|nr:hypothetical protein PHYPA_001586 [Physcomitrium patens]
MVLGILLIYPKKKKAITSKWIFKIKAKKQCYADAGHGRDIDTRSPIIGLIYKLGKSPIDWSNKRQATVALSTTEGDYCVLFEVAKDVIHLRRMLKELKIICANPSLILSDNQSCIRLVDNPILHSRTKHIEIQYHFIREKSLAGDVIVDYVPSSEQQADILTKLLDTFTYGCMHKAINITPIPSSN